MTTTTTIYEPTDPTAVFVAGQRIPEDRRIELTEDEARYELMAGTIRAVEDRTAQGRKTRQKGEEA